jgi:two-component system chemotaxis response regulator CheY
MAKILIVDDSKFSRKALRAFLESQGHTVFEAADGMSALEQFSIHEPDLVSLDLTMQGLGGLETLEKLKNIKPDVKVIIATADIQRSTREAVEKSGACGFVSKPFSKENIIAAVNAALTK